MEKSSENVLFLEEKKLPKDYIIGSSCALMTNDKSHFAVLLKKSNGEEYEGWLKDKELEMLAATNKRKYLNGDMFADVIKEISEKNICHNGKNCSTCPTYLLAVRKLNTEA
jgi:hypothetical protein